MGRDGVIQLLNHYAGLDRGGQIFGIYFQNPVHSLE